MRALLLQAFYSIRSERQLVDRARPRPVVPLVCRAPGIEDPVWDATTFTKNRDRLLEGEVAGQFLAAVLSQARVKALLSSDHFSVDGTLSKPGRASKALAQRTARASHPAPDATASGTFTASPSTNDTHASTTDPDARSIVRGWARRPGSVSSAMP